MTEFDSSIQGFDSSIKDNIKDPGGTPDPKSHVQGTDQGLDTGGPNAVTAAELADIANVLSVVLGELISSSSLKLTASTLGQQILQLEGSEGQTFTREFSSAALGRVYDRISVARWELFLNGNAGRVLQVIGGGGGSTSLNLYDRDGDGIANCNHGFYLGETLIGRWGYFNLGDNSMLIQQVHPTGPLSFSTSGTGEVRFSPGNVLGQRQNATGWALFGKVPNSQEAWVAYPTSNTLQEVLSRYGLITTGTTGLKSLVITNATHTISSEQAVEAAGTGANENQTITLPPTGPLPDGYSIRIKQTTTGTKTIDTSGVETIDGSATLDLLGVGSAFEFLWFDSANKWSTF